MFGRKKKTAEYVADPRFAPAADAQPSAPAAPGVPVTAGTPTLTVVDVFTITGRGLVASGEVAGGTLRVGQPVEVQRDGGVVLTSSITGLSVAKEVLDSAEPGQNVGVLLPKAPKGAVQPGDLIVAAG